MNPSLPARGVWIEITSHQSWYNAVGSLPARGVWIEIRSRVTWLLMRSRRSPQGECGLKFEDLTGARAVVEVAPRKGSVD